MPNCRNCKARISKFDKDICPVCGCPNPLEGVTSETVEITTQIDLNGFKEGQRVVRRRKMMLILFCVCGFTGAGFFYLRRKALGFIYLFLNLLLLGGLFSVFYFPIQIGLPLAIIIPFIIVYVINSAIGVVFRFLPDLKDGEGEFVV